MEEKKSGHQSPTAFDSAFWGITNIISPTEKIRDIIRQFPIQTMNLFRRAHWKAGNIKTKGSSRQAADRYPHFVATNKKRLGK